jgi:hypothetical protein
MIVIIYVNVFPTPKIFNKTQLKIIIARHMVNLSLYSRLHWYERGPGVA